MVLGGSRVGSMKSTTLHSVSIGAVYLQIASTWEGIRACEILQKQGIDTNMTLLFSFAQVLINFLPSLKPPCISFARQEACAMLCDVQTSTSSPGRDVNNSTSISPGFSNWIPNLVPKQTSLQ